MRNTIFMLLVLCTIMSCHKRTKEEKLQQWKNRLSKFEANQKKSDTLNLTNDINTVPLQSNSNHSK
jgi:hypothetical protein